MDVNNSLTSTLSKNKYLKTKFYMPKLAGISHTLICKIITPNGEHVVRAILDDGSQISAVTETIAKKIGINWPQKITQIRNFWRSNQNLQQPNGCAVPIGISGWKIYNGFSNGSNYDAKSNSRCETH